MPSTAPPQQRSGKGASKGPVPTPVQVLGPSPSSAWAFGPPGAHSGDPVPGYAFQAVPSRAEGHPPQAQGTPGRRGPREATVRMDVQGTPPERAGRTEGSVDPGPGGTWIRLESVEDEVLQSLGREKVARLGVEKASQRVEQARQLVTSLEVQLGQARGDLERAREAWARAEAERAREEATISQMKAKCLGLTQGVGVELLAACTALVKVAKVLSLPDCLGEVLSEVERHARRAGAGDSPGTGGRADPPAPRPMDLDTDLLGIREQQQGLAPGVAPVSPTPVPTLVSGDEAVTQEPPACAGGGEEEEVPVLLGSPTTPVTAPAQEEEETPCLPTDFVRTFEVDASGGSEGESEVATPRGRSPRLSGRGRPALKKSLSVLRVARVGRARAGRGASRGRGRGRASSHPPPVSLSTGEGKKMRLEAAFALGAAVDPGTGQPRAAPAQ